MAEGAALVPTGASRVDQLQGVSRCVLHALWAIALTYLRPDVFVPPRDHTSAIKGAIMFNDTLTLEQCKSLVQRLAATALPFQCAHGR